MLDPTAEIAGGNETGHADHPEGSGRERNKSRGKGGKQKVRARAPTNPKEGEEAAKKLVKRGLEY